MTNRPLSLRWLIGGTYFLVMFAALGVMALVFAHQHAQNSRAMARGAVRWQGAVCARLLASSRTSHEAQTLLTTIFERARLAHMDVAPPRQVVLFTDTGTILAALPAHADSPRANPLPPPTAPRTGTADSQMYDAKTGIWFLSHAVRVHFSPGLAIAGQAPATDATLRIDIPLDTHHWWTSPLFTRSALSAFATILLTFLFVNILISRSLARPIAELSAAAQRLAQGDLHARVVPSGADDIVSLGRSFNGMAKQLRQMISRLGIERAQAQAMLTSMANGILVTDATGRLLVVNRRAEQLFGIKADLMLGRTLTEAILHYELQDLLTKTLAQGIPLKQDITLALPQARTLEVHLAPVAVNSRLDGVVIALYDVTEQRLLHTIHRDFMSNVSHELRTPVASIRAMSETLLDAGQDDPEMAQDFLQSMVTESERLTALLDDLLQLLKMDAAHHLITPEILDAGEVIRDVARRLTIPITQKRQQLRLELPAQLPAYADHDALVQILVNLIDNARKYSPEGAQITVRGDVDIAGETMIAVADTGYGIPAHALGRLFERFYRVDKGRSRAEGGTGLGLAIVKQLTELHGGRISVSSHTGEGSCFTILLPAPPAERHPCVVDASPAPHLAS